MCRFPLRIQNKGYKPKDFLSPLYISVPCGHCPECKNAKISEFLYRCTHEYDYTVKHNGFACFLTLTFNPQHLNIVTFDDGTTCSTWNNVFLSKFKMNLQTCLSRLGYSLKYVCTSERGSHGSKRPHYHLILFVVPLSTSTPLNSYQVSLLCAKYWSTSPRSSSGLDVSKKYNSKPCSMFVSSKEPIGLIYNEQISRTESEAIKYVVKYCVKDGVDTIYTPKRIVSSSLGISDIDMKPRTTQSNGIGISFLDSLPYTYNRFDVEVGFESLTADYLLNSRPLCSDGTPVNIPRYYVKRLSQRAQILARYPIHDDTEFFNGTEYAPKFSHDEPLFILSNADLGSKLYPLCSPHLTMLSTYRYCTKSKTFNSVFGSYLGEASQVLRAQLLWDTLCSTMRYSFNCIHNVYEPYLHLADPHFVDLIARMVTSKIDFRPLMLCGFKEFFRLYRLYCHNVNAKFHDNVRLLDLFISLVAFSKLYNGIENTCRNDKRYKDNLYNAIQKRPLLFLKREK